MLKELQNVSQIPGELRRRWFQDEQMELIVWLTDEAEISAFELSYDLEAEWRVVRWTTESGCRHLGVLSGDGGDQQHEAVPILVPNDHFVAHEVAASFNARSHQLDTQISDFVYGEVLRCQVNYPSDSN